MLLLDADICIDLFRDYSPALQWFASLTEQPALPGLVVLELLAGCRDSGELNKTRRFTRQFKVYWPTEQDCERAVETYARLRLRAGLSTNDALIAECAIGLQATLCTFNVKDFQRIVRLIHMQPYRRS